jgi:Sec23-binding domain of Sec16
VDKHGAVHSLDGCTASSPEGLIVSLLLDGPSAQPLSLSPNQGLEQEQLLERVQLYSAFETATVTSGSSSSGSSSTSASPPHSSSMLALHTLKDKDSTKGELYAHLEGLLLRGKREEAVAAAVGHREWPIALLIASNCGPEEYREVTKAYATCTFPNASPLHLAALLFSNQVGLQCCLPHILSHFI